MDLINNVILNICFVIMICIIMVLIMVCCFVGIVECFYFLKVLIEKHKKNKDKPRTTAGFYFDGYLEKMY